MDRDQLFAFIRSKGGNKCIVHFSGGGDEGGCDNIVILKDDTIICELDENYEGQMYDPELQKFIPINQKPEDKFVRGLCQPVYDKYYSFAGEYSVDGTVTWDCKNKTCKMEGSEEVPSYNGFEEDC